MESEQIPVVKSLIAGHGHPKSEKEVIARIKNKSRGNSGTVFVDPILELENTAPKGNISPEIRNLGVKGFPTPKRGIAMKPEAEPKPKPSSNRKATPGKKLTSLTKSKSVLKRMRSLESESEDSSSSLDVPPTNRKLGYRTLASPSISRQRSRSSSGTPKKVLRRMSPDLVPDSEDDEDYVPSLSPRKMKTSSSGRKKRVTVPHSAKKAIKRKNIPLKNTTLIKSPISSPQAPMLQYSFLDVPVALSYPDKYFIKHRRCFALRNYWKVRTYVKTLTRTSIRKRKPVKPVLPLRRQARLELTVQKLKKTKGRFSTYFRSITARPTSENEKESLAVASKQGLFLKRNYLKAIENSSLHLLSKSPTSNKIGATGKGTDLKKMYFQEGSPGFYPKGIIANQKQETSSLC